MNQKNTLALVKAAPLLYRLYGATDSGWSIQLGFACGDGWFNILMRLSMKMEADLQAMLAAGKRKQDLPVALQVKEKYATLRFHVGGNYPAQWREWIEEAVAESARTCELCGEPGEWSVHGGWERTLCPHHLLLSGHVPGNFGEFDFKKALAPTGEPREGVDLFGSVHLATGDLDVWAPAGKGLSKAVVYADDLPPALWPALSKLADDTGGIRVSEVTNYLYSNRWLPNVRAVLGLPPVEPGGFVEEAERMIRESEMELVGSVVLPACKGAVPVFVHSYSPRGMKIVVWKHMPESVKLEFMKWHFGAQDHEGPYWYDFQAWVRSKR